MTDELTARVAGMDIAADMASKYAVDTSLFDALVDKASSGGNSESATPAAAEAPRALKQRLLQPDDADIAFLADRLLQRLAEGHGECMFETGYEGMCGLLAPHPE
ncbi:hypothetical protein H4S01_006409 [Coemansia sp. RSA 2610]|nr:hypothetical protein H4S01_006409 [Coemansia sp. RSA 2610]